jgi:hypothetical protein
MANARTHQSDSIVLPRLCPSVASFVSDFEEGEIGADLFRHACKLGLRRNGVQAPGSPLSRRPISELDQSENRKHPAMSRVADSFA